MLNNTSNRESLLIVDDELENIDLLINILQNKYKVIVATSGEKALKIIETKSFPALILLDVNMPGIDGFEVCERLKSNTRTSSIPVIFITAESNIESEECGLKLGAVDYITKPFTPELVKARVRNQLELKQHRDSLEVLVQERGNALDEAYSQNSLLLDCISEGVCGVDLSGNITFVNPAACKILGYEQHQLLNKSFHTLILHSHIDGKEYPKPLYKSYEQGISQHAIEEVFWCKNNVQICTEYTCSPVFKNNIVVGAVIVFKDISERKRMGKLKDEFISTINHELRTPLVSIKGAVDIILGGVMGELPEKMSPLLKSAQQNSERLHYVIDNLLDIELIESGKLSINKQPVLFNDIIKKALAVNSSNAENFNIQLISSFSNTDKVSINGDSRRLIQAFSNLLSNAIKYSSNNSVVNILMKSDAHNIFISVVDRGSGIPEGIQDKIFERFFQQDSSNTRNPGGIGLGLSIAKEIIERHYGNISYESVLDKGSTFQVTLPVLN